MHGSRSKIPSKKISSCNVLRRDLIPVLITLAGVLGCIVPNSTVISG
jgi:hypothetical protein